MPNSRGFTLIELLVVISIIAVLSVTGIVVYTKAQMLARDAKRKGDLNAIYTALELYRSQNGKYPQAKSSCSYGFDCYSKSSDGDWLAVLVPDFMPAVPVDPVNDGFNPWENSDGKGYTYTYGGVSSDGQSYDLTAKLENIADPDRCGVKDYKYCRNAPWCKAFSGPYNNQIYEKSPPLSTSFSGTVCGLP